MDLVRSLINSAHLPGPWIALAIGAVALAVLPTLLAVKNDPQEPPFLPTTIPLIGHLILILRFGAAYFLRLENRYHQHLYALPILRGRWYIASSPDWAQAVHKATKPLSFNELVAQAMSNIFQMDKPTMAVIRNNMNHENGDRSGVIWETHDMTFKTLAPGKDVDELNRNFFLQFAPYVNALAKGGEVTTVPLWYWFRHHVTLANMTALWGPETPFALDPNLVDDFWVMEKNVGKLMMIPLPSLTIPRAYKARQRCLDAFAKYGENDRYKLGSQFIKNRADINLRNGFTKDMYGRGEVAMVFGAVVNTVPSAFWLTSWIFADLRILAEVRAEIDRCFRTSSGNKRTINATMLKTRCSLLNSLFRESLRLTASVNVNRYVLEDTLLSNPTSGESYLLKKDSMVTIASNVIHYTSGMYGKDADTFQQRRFLPTVEKSRSEAGDNKPVDPAAAFRDASGKVHRGAFRTFGGGHNICPGRHFAQTEILSITALFVAGFEIESVGGTSGKYVPPPFEPMTLSVNVLKPKHDVQVNVRRRKGFEDTEWELEL